MPLASPIGSGQENSKIPVVIDAGIGTSSDACKAMELGASSILLNTAIAKAKNPVKMAQSMAKAVEAGYEAFSAGRISIKEKASASYPILDIIL
eukprot:8472781-Lingulodinium_polyedra.AAC.1